MSDELAFDSAVSLAQKIQSKEISTVELTQMYIDRIEKHDGDINAVVVRIFDRALADAEQADAALAKGENLGPLHGVPMTIKESYVIEGTPATWGIPDFANNIGKQDGLAVQRFRNAGAHFLGKTNVPLNLADFQSYNDIYGTTGNPYDTSRTPGGSSGGSAAAMAAGFSGLEAGSDIGGSIRNPAHFCGVYGHKPTYGIIPMQGHELIPSPEADQAVCGPIARSAEDLKLAMDIMAGPAEREAVGWSLTLPKPRFNSLKGLRVAVWPSDEQAPVTAETADRVQQVADTLAAKGAVVSDTARPEMDLRRAHVNYQILLNGVMSISMTEKQVEDTMKLVEQLDPNDQSNDATMARSAVMQHRDWIRANAERENIRHAWTAFFKEWDILICPQMATPAFPHDHSPQGDRKLQVDNVEQPYFQQLFWAGMIVNAYLPSTVFPTGLSKEGLPIGLQAVSDAYRDHDSMEFARLITQEMGGFTPPPGLS